MSVPSPRQPAYVSAMRSVLVLLALTVPAAAEEVRAGPAAYGDWRGDAPGVVRHITPADLPPPLATRSNAEGPEIVPRPPHAVPRAPAGFTVTLFASALEGPRVMRPAPDGSVFVAESGGGRVTRLRSDGSRSPFVAGLDAPYGIAFWPPDAPRFVYVAESSRVLRFAWQPGQTRAGPPQTVIDGIPTGGHWTRDLAVAPDGSRLFLAVGSGSNVAEASRPLPAGGLAAWQAAHGLGAAYNEEAGRAAVLWFEPDGGTGLHPYAQGLRNCAGLAVQPGSGALWCVVNERDGLGDNLPPDYATSLREGAFYGWPWYYIGSHAEPRLPGDRPDLDGRAVVPDVLLQPHSAPLGIAFYTGATFPPAYRGDAFVTLHGSWNRAQRTGYKVVRLHLSGGRADGSYEDFLTGFVAAENAVWGRPVGVAVAPDGALLVSEDANGNIWRVAPTPP